MQAFDKFMKWGESQGFVGYISDKTGLNRFYTFIILCVVSFLLTLSAILNGFVLFAVGVLGPAYSSYKAIESPSKEDDTRMLYYWCVLGVLITLDRFAGFVLDIIGFAGVIKFAILVALIMDDYALSKLVYEKTIGPLLKKYNTKIDKAADAMTKQGKAMLEEQGKTLLADAQKKVTEKITEEVTKKVTEQVNQKVSEAMGEQATKKTT